MLRIEVFNRQRKVRFDLRWLREFAHRALPACLSEAGPGERNLPKLENVEISLVSDRVIADIHQQFMNIPTPTDVITFNHGEILISAETAKANAAIYGKPLEEELGRYVVHGLLHLNGFEDQAPAQSKQMHRVQERIVKACLALFLALLIGLAPAVANAQQSADGPAIDYAALLKALKDLKEQQVKTEKASLSKIISQFTTACATPSAAMDFYEQAIMATQFEGQNRENTQLRDWKKKNEEKLKSRDLQLALRLHLQYLTMTLRRAAGATNEELLSSLISYCQQVDMEKQNLASQNELMRKPIHESVFVKWQNLGPILQGIKGWEMHPGNTDAIADKSILPIYREKKDIRLIDYWNNKIQKESSEVALSKLTFNNENFENIRKPSLMWSRAQDCLQIGLRNKAIGEMFNLVKTYPNHPENKAWFSKLESVLQTAAQAQPAPAESAQ